MKVGDPVLDFECAYPREVCDIRGHQHRFQGIGMGSDEPVIWPDRLAGCFQLCANTGIFSVGGDIEGKDLEAVQNGLDQIGRASWRERVCQHVSSSVVAVELKKT